MKASLNSTNRSLGWSSRLIGYILLLISKNSLSLLGNRGHSIFFGSSWYTIPRETTTITERPSGQPHGASSLGVTLVSFPVGAIDGSRPSSA